MLNMLYAVNVEERIKRIAYVEAESPAEAKALAFDPSNWWDADEPKNSTPNIRVSGMPKKHEE